MNTPYMAAALEIKDLMQAKCSPEFIARIIEDHTGRIHNPDPEELGVELAGYIQERWNQLENHPDAFAILSADEREVRIFLEMMWQIQFWRGKVLNPEEGA